MPKISPNYKNDSDEGLPDEIRAWLDEHYVAGLPNIKQPNPKLVVLFSGGNAVGKTTISRLLEKEFGALVLENDAVKRMLMSGFPNLDRDALNRYTWQYTIKLYPRLSALTPNGLIVRDGIIDWYYDRILPVLSNAGYELFIVGLDVSRAKAMELIAARGDTPTVKEERFYVLLDDHEIHRKRFRAEYTPDLILTDENLFQHDLVVEALRGKLTSRNA